MTPPFKDLDGTRTSFARLWWNPNFRFYLPSEITTNPCPPNWPRLLKDLTWLLDLVVLSFTERHLQNRFSVIDKQFFYFLFFLFVWLYHVIMIRERERVGGQKKRRMQKAIDPPGTLNLLRPSVTLTFI